MAAFLETQLDFIFFFYGLAFILLGAVSFAIARGGQEKTDWTMLGLFGFVHGASEWLDLVALIITDGPGFAAVRTAVMTASYVFLAEFARQEAIRLGWKMPERWVYLPLVALVALAGILDGVPTANAVARYALGFGGAMATGFMFAWHARGLSGDHRRLAISAAAGFAIYAVAAGAIAPAAPIWPATVLNHQWFVRSTGIPIQLIRGLLACWIAFSVWAIWGQKLVQELSSARYTRFVQRQFTRTLMAMGTIVVSGWLLTNYLGEIYNQNVQADASNDLNLLSSRLAAETAITDGMARLLAGAPSIHGLLKEGKASSGRHMLDLTVEASGAELGYIVDRAGTVVATAGKLERAARDPTYAGAPSIQKSLAGEADHAFAFDAASGSRDYYASYPIRDGSDVVVGAAVLKKSLRGFEKSLANYDAIYFLLDPNGIVMLSNRLKYMLRSLWAVPVEKQLELTRQFGQLNYNPLVKREIAESGWTAVDGVRAYVSRRFFDRGQWSLAIVKPPERIYASRVLGIAITLLATVAALVYLLASERAVHDRVSNGQAAGAAGDGQRLSVPGHHGRPDGPQQQAALQRGNVAGDLEGAALRHSAVSRTFRHRSLQADQRYARPSGGRQGAGRAVPLRRASDPRCRRARALGRGGVRDPPAGVRRQHGVPVCAEIARVARGPPIRRGRRRDMQLWRRPIRARGSGEDHRLPRRQGAVPREAQRPQ
jgi:hypothetical protein